MNEEISKNTFSSKHEEVKMYGEIEWMQVKRLRQEGYGYKTIGRELNMDRRTAKKLSLMEKPPRQCKRQKRSVLDEFKIYIDLWLKDKPRLRATVIQDRIEKLGWRGNYSTVKRYVRKKKNELLREATVRFETLPGQQAQVDFGCVKVKYLNGEEERINIYLMTLGFSRMKYADISNYKNRCALMYLMERSFWSIGGVSEEILFDNLKPVADKPRTFTSEGKISEEWKKFESYYGFETKLSMVWRAQTKGKVEKPIEPVKRFIESNIFLNKEHLREELKKEIGRWNRKVHSTTKQTPEERFQQEKPFLQALPVKPYDFARVEKRKVSKDCFVSVEGVGYSVPDRYSGEKVEVRITETEVQVFSSKGALISSYRKLSSEDKKKYRYVVQKEHYRRVAGYEKAFLNFKKLNDMGFGPFLVVEKRPLEFYEGVIR